MESTNWRRIPRYLLLGAAVLVFPSACIGASSGGGSASGPQVDVTLRDFKIEPAATKAASGNVTLSVHNAAPMTHEFVVVRSNLAPDDLSIGSDGVSIDEDKLHIIDELGDIQAGSTDSLKLDLSPGRYVYFCNLEGHYLGGMRGVLTVSDNA